MNDLLQFWNKNIKDEYGTYFDKTKENLSKTNVGLIAKFRLKLKKVGKTTRPFRYDLNQMPYDYTVEMGNNDRVPEELWTEVHDTVQDTGVKIIPQRKEMQKNKMALWGGLTNICEKKRGEKKGEKDIPIWIHRSKE